MQGTDVSGAIGGGSLAAGAQRLLQEAPAISTEALVGCWHFHDQPPGGETPTLFLTVGQSRTALGSRSLSCLVLTDPLHDVS